ncbi:MAG: hypothetical protein KGJ55_09670 [Gammaproteobacteria bacterium]|nr:hypothetical protein [Gammaproteobacteria bacterium]
MTHWSPVFKGIATYIPGLYAAIQRRKPVRSGNAKYYYEQWLKHLTLMWENGMRRIPPTLVEFGPGQPLGLGIAALLSGVQHYYALDVVLFEAPEKIWPCLMLLSPCSGNAPASPENTVLVSSNISTPAVSLPIS